MAKQTYLSEGQTQMTELYTDRAQIDAELDALFESPDPSDATLDRIDELLEVRERVGTASRSAPTSMGKEIDTELRDLAGRMDDAREAFTTATTADRPLAAARLEAIIKRQGELEQAAVFAAYDSDQLAALAEDKAIEEETAREKIRSYDKPGQKLRRERAEREHREVWEQKARAANEIKRWRDEAAWTAARAASLQAAVDREIRAQWSAHWKKQEDIAKSEAARDPKMAWRVDEVRAKSQQPIELPQRTVDAIRARDRGRVRRRHRTRRPSESEDVDAREEEDRCTR